ncbi:hypothetical protein CROQUDRAFT_434272 [Cronartium quercuum f. sp. fusiforme G11]|uniref:Uncharacterized protein n=1 Tax=Cronartium quercuum f. sp. fusiforme G11 TaxID=708437 RepID=A0A9P6NR34_9BASI|nr:hypothetical protein CROQUDRAFT_434272 [Cronartium quercuum f. sp. fusiforme G11]
MSSFFQRLLLRPSSSAGVMVSRSYALGPSTLRFDRATYASEASEPVPAFRIPTTESEVAEMLARATNPDERKKIFESLLGAQKPVPLPPTPKGPSGVHLVPIGRKKTKTDYVGVPVHHSPFETLIHTYKTTLKTLEKFPKGAVYRQSVESLTQVRLEIISKYNTPGGDGAEAVEQRVKDAESELGVHLIEEAIHQAEDEHSLALSIFESQAWQDLQEKPAPGQWEYFPVPSSTSYPKD